MSYAAETPFGRLERVTRDGETAFLLRCPGCGERGALDDDQYHGRVSVDHASVGCAGGYHETHDFAAAVVEAGGFQPVEPRDDATRS